MYHSRSEAIFFGLMSNWRETFLEEVFLLQYHLKMTYSDARSLPIQYRQWFLDRLAKEFTREAEAHKKARNESSGRTSVTQDVPMGEVMTNLASGEKKF
jgi:hypothetical protein